MKRIALLMLMPAMAAGCASRVVETANPIPVATHEYDRVFEAAVQVLRENWFVVMRQDRRFGIVSTEPQYASSIAEPWRKDNTTGHQAWDNTLNFQRRTVHISIEPRQDVAGSAPAYQLAVTVEVERREHPDRQLTTAAVSSVAYYNRGAGVRSVRTEQGEQTTRWYPVGRDEPLEQRLIDAILHRANEIQPQHTTVGDASGRPVDSIPLR